MFPLSKLLAMGSKPSIIDVPTFKARNPILAEWVGKECPGEYDDRFLCKMKFHVNTMPDDVLERFVQNFPQWERDMDGPPKTCFLGISYTSQTGFVGPDEVSVSAIKKISSDFVAACEADGYTPQEVATFISKHDELPELKLVDKHSYAGNQGCVFYIPDVPIVPSEGLHD